MGYIGFIYIHNNESNMVLRDIVKWENEDIKVSESQMLQIKLGPGEDYLGLISTTKQGQVQFNF
jgi:hypothetical protein